MAVTPSTRPREADSPRTARRLTRRRLSLSHVLIAVVVILAFVLNLLVLQDRSSTTLVAVADQPLSAGSAIDPTTLRLVPVGSNFEGLPDLISEAELPGLEGLVLSRAIEEGGLLDETALITPGSRSGLRSMSLPVPVEHASGGALVPGDRVDVISVTDGTARFVATDLEVVSVADRESGAIASATAYHVVVTVEADEALALAEALDRGSVEIVRSTGSEAIDERSLDGS